MRRILVWTVTLGILLGIAAAPAAAAAAKTKKTPPAPGAKDVTPPAKDATPPAKAPAAATKDKAKDKPKDKPKDPPPPPKDAAPAKAVTQEQVIAAIEKGKKFLIGKQAADGTWKEEGVHQAAGPFGSSEMAFFTLAYIGEHPNKDHMTKAMNTIMVRPLGHVYSIAMRTMALAKLQGQLAEEKRDMIRKSLQLDAQFLWQAQGAHGAWSYMTPVEKFDFSNTQMAILALREAALAGIEVPEIVWRKNQEAYFKRQQPDGSWNYGDFYEHKGVKTPGYGSMTAAGLASVFITTDNLDLGSGCPCRGGSSTRTKGDFERRIDLCLSWLEKNFRADANPRFPSISNPGTSKFYWLYAVERVGIAAGYKYFGAHNWYKEGAAQILKDQKADGSWGTLSDTCFSILFLYKGLAPILFNKLEFKDAYKNVADQNDWNNHRRDIANLTAYIEKQKEQMFHWQIVSLKAPVDELHDAPILFITPETPPEFSEEHKKKLRAFTDTGGTILIEASCGNPRVRTWAATFIKEVWPEWTLKPLGSDHGSFSDPNPLKQRPEMMGIDDGLRTCVFYSMDDIGCPWQTKAYTGKEYLFKWGINLYSYATDKGPLRSRLAPRDAAKADRYKEAVKSGDRNTLKLVRVKYDGAGWLTGRNYGLLPRLVTEVKSRAGVTLTVDESGLGAAGLGDADIAYLTGSGELKLAETDKAGLKAFADKGGLVWIEASSGAVAFDQQVRKTMGDLGWEVKPLPATSPVMTGKMDKAAGYSLIANVQFNRALRVTRLGRPQAELHGLYQGEKLVGVYSPFDILYSMTSYEAYNNRGYQNDDAKAVATNIVLLASSRPKGGE